MVVVAFIHPDLGIGGAERLICDAALALQKEKHEVKIFTSHHDKKHCFAETADGTLKVIAVGDWLPRHTFHRMYALWAYIRMIYVAFYLVFISNIEPDVIICDQISACIPILKISKKAKIIFYCHFPDLLLTGRGSFLKKMYRMPIDWLEEFTTGLANVVLVNSRFTAKIFQETFQSLYSIRPKILYPSLNFDAFHISTEKEAKEIKDRISPTAEYIFLSINRYERKKNLPLAINALKYLKQHCSPNVWLKVHLIMAGGYDERVEENKTHFIELEELTKSLELKEKVTFLRSFSDKEKIALLQKATCLLYTPSNEHFGIVPVEAMYMKCPVVACNSGGPLETVKHKGTGFLCEPTEAEFGGAMMKFIENPMMKKELGSQGHTRVIKNFSFDAFTKNLNEIVVDASKRGSLDNNDIVRYSFAAVFGLILFIIIVKFNFFLSYLLNN